MDEIFHKSPGKFARIFWLTILGLFLFVAAALAIFVLTFDADRYRPLITEKLEKSLGRPIELEKIKLGWHEGLALDIQGLTLYQQAPSKQKFLRLNSAAIKVSPMPLLHQELQVSSVIIENPEMTLTRNPAGRIVELTPPMETTSVASSQPALQEQAPSEPEAKTAQRETPPAAALSFLVDLIKIKKGTLHYIDQANPADIRVRDIDIVVQDISPVRPLSLDARAAVFSDSQNLGIDGKLRLVPEESGAVLENFTASIDLSRTDPVELLKSFPMLQKVGIARGMTGQLESRINRLKVSAGKVTEMDADMHLQQGSIKTGSMPLPLENLVMDATFTPGYITLQNLSGSMGQGRIEISGKSQTGASSQMQFQAAVSQMNFSEWIPPVSDRDPHLEGNFAGNLRGSAQGGSTVAMAQTLTGDGNLELRGLVLRNMNVLREILKKISMLPAVGKSLDKNLSEEYRQRLENPDTVFNPVQIPLLVQQGSVFFDHVLIQSDSFALLASGRIGLLGGIQMSAVLIMDAELSAALARSLNELQYLMDAQGQLQIPLVQAPGPKFSLVPDISYIASKLAMGKGQQVLTDLIKKKQQGNVDPNAPVGTNQYGSGYQQQQQGGTTDYRKMKGKDLLNQFLQTALESQGGGSSSNQR